MPNPINPQPPLEPMQPAYPLDYASNPPVASGFELGGLALLVGFGLLLYWAHGDKARGKTSWES